MNGNETNFLISYRQMYIWIQGYIEENRPPIYKYFLLFIITTICSMSILLIAVYIYIEIFNPRTLGLLYQRLQTLETNNLPRCQYFLCIQFSINNCAYCSRSNLNVKFPALSISWIIIVGSHQKKKTWPWFDLEGHRKVKSKITVK